VPTTKPEKKDRTKQKQMQQHNKLNQRGFKVRIEGVANMEDDDDEIEEDI